MGRPINQAEIQQYTSDRAVLEVQMCKALYALYDSAPIRPALQSTIGFAFEQIAAHLVDTIGTGKNPKEKEVTEEGQKESKLQVFAKFAGGPAKSAAELKDKCLRVWRARSQWSAADCSDVSRWMGSVLEKVKDAPGFGTLNKYEKQDKPQNPKEKDRFFKNMPDQGGRARVETGKYQQSALERQHGALHAEIGRGAGLAVKIPVYDAKGRVPSGAELFRMLPSSTVRKIDLAFGLAEGGDLSGTTADSIIVNRLMLTFLQGALGMREQDRAMNKVLQLLPLVTMVSHGHHTLVESALTLTLSGFCDYQIGFYTSLLTGRDHTYDAEGDILRILARVERDKNNHHILCWFDPREMMYVGEECETAEELKMFREYATTSKKFVLYFRDGVSSLVFRPELLKWGDISPAMA